MAQPNRGDHKSKFSEQQQELIFEVATTYYKTGERRNWPLVSLYLFEATNAFGQPPDPDLLESSWHTISNKFKNRIKSRDPAQREKKRIQEQLRRKKKRNMSDNNDNNNENQPRRYSEEEIEAILQGQEETYKGFFRTFFVESYEEWSDEKIEQVVHGNWSNISDWAYTECLGEPTLVPRVVLRKAYDGKMKDLEAKKRLQDEETREREVRDNQLSTDFVNLGGDVMERVFQRIQSPGRPVPVRPVQRITHDEDGTPTPLRLDNGVGGLQRGCGSPSRAPNNNAFNGAHYSPYRGARGSPFVGNHAPSPFAQLNNAPGPSPARLHRGDSASGNDLQAFGGGARQSPFGGGARQSPFGDNNSRSPSPFAGFGGSAQAPFGGASIQAAFGGSTQSAFGGSSTRAAFGGSSNQAAFGGSAEAAFGESSNVARLPLAAGDNRAYRDDATRIRRNKKRKVPSPSPSKENKKYKSEE